MASFVAQETSYIGDRIILAGETVEYHGITGANLECTGDGTAAQETARKALLAEARATGAQLHDNTGVEEITKALTRHRERDVI